MYLAQVRLPELQVAAGDERGPYGVVEHVFDPELGHDAGLVVGDAQLLGHLMTPLRRKDICWFNGSRDPAKIPHSTVLIVHVFRLHVLQTVGNHSRKANGSHLARGRRARFTASRSA